MKIKPQTEALGKILDLAGRAVKHNSAVPVLTSVLFEADQENSTLTVASTDTELAIRVVAGQCQVEEGGKAAIRAGLLANVVKSLSEQEAEISATESEATLTTEKGSYSINAYRAADFPKLPEFPKENSFSVKADALSAAIAKVLPFTSREELRPVLAGALVTFEDGTLTMAATDSYRLGVARKKLEAREMEGGPREKVSQIIPARALREVSRLASMTEKIRISITENQAMFHAQGVTIATRLIDGNFPEYQRLLPPSFEKTFRVNRAELMSSLKRVNLFCGKTNPPTPVRLSFTTGKESLMGDELVVAGASQEVGAAREVISFTNEDSREGQAGNDSPDPEEFIVAFNPQYLFDSVSTAGTEDILFKFNEPMKPAMIFPAGQDDDAPEVRMLLMPMRDQYAEEENRAKAKPKAGKEAGAAQPAQTDAAEEKVPAGS